jgi:hypothetical protein
MYLRTRQLDKDIHVYCSLAKCLRYRSPLTKETFCQFQIYAIFHLCSVFLTAVKDLKLESRFASRILVLLSDALFFRESFNFPHLARGCTLLLKFFSVLYEKVRYYSSMLFFVIFGIDPMTDNRIWFKIRLELSRKSEIQSTHTSSRIIRKYPISNFMTTPPLEFDLIHGDRQAEGRTQVITRLTGAFCDFANVPKTLMALHAYGGFHSALVLEGTLVLSSHYRSNEFHGTESSARLAVW